MRFEEVILILFGLLFGSGVTAIFFLWSHRGGASNRQIFHKILNFVSDGQYQYLSMLNMEKSVRNLLSALADVPDVRLARLLQVEDDFVVDVVSETILEDPLILTELRKLLSYRDEESVGFGSNNILYSFLKVKKDFYSRYNGRAFVLSVPYQRFDYVLLVFTHRKPVVPDLKRILLYYKRIIFFFLYFHDYSGKSKENFELLDQVFLKSPIAMSVTDQLGKIGKANARFYSLFGRNLHQIQSIFGKEVFDRLREGKSYEKELEYGELFLNIYSHPIYDQKGEVKGGVFSVIDQSVQHLLYRKLESSEERYRTLIKKLPIGLVILNREGSIYFVNDNFLFSLGLREPSEAENKNLTDFFRIGKKEFQDILSGIETQNALAYKIESRPEFEERMFSVTLRKVFMQNEELIEMVCQDISLQNALYAELEDKSRILDEELRTAQMVQEHILAIPPIYNAGVRFETFYKPSSELGGDFYDILNIDENHIGVLMADVSGHGVSAALITAMLKILVEFSPRDPHKLEEMINYLNSGLLRIMPEDHFITLFYGVVDTQSYQMDYVNCGHPYPLIYDQKTQEVMPLKGMGFPIGSFSKSILDIHVKNIKLPENSKILFYTDGLFTFKVKNTHLNLAGLSEKLKENLSVRRKDVLNSLYIDILTHSEKMVDDDISMLMLSINRELSYKNFLSIPSNVLEIDFAIVRIMEELRKHLKMGEEDEWKLYTSLYEALINAVEHGNKFNVQKRVTVIYRIFKHLVVFKVRDEGSGFVVKDVPDPLDMENLLKPSGRGLFMMEKLTKKVKYNRKGNEVTMFIQMRGSDIG